MCVCLCVRGGVCVRARCGGYASGRTGGGGGVRWGHHAMIGSVLAASSRRIGQVG